MPTDPTPPDIIASTAAYEHWLGSHLKRELIHDDLTRKHKLMAREPFRFLRATYWRWCEVVPDLHPELSEAPVGAAIGDLHMDNFGTFRDVEGRLVWGVNDFDEAARQPLAYDLARLAVSAKLRLVATPSAEISKAILRGYRVGLAAPQPIILDREFDWLRARVHIADEDRREFWDNLAALSPGTPPRDMAVALRAAMPDPKVPVTFAPRSAGGGSLGRPRFIAIGAWRGGAAVREAKRLVPSAWMYAKRSKAAGTSPHALACGPYRSPDPFYRQPTDDLLVRRLSPNNRKIDAKDLLRPAEIERVLETMGRDVAAIHAASRNASAAMTAYTARTLNAARLARITDQLFAWVRSDFEAWKAQQGASQ
jgi:hypothetical protein